MRKVLLFLGKSPPLKVVICFHILGGVSIGYHLHPDPCVPQALNLLVQGGQALQPRERVARRFFRSTEKGKAEPVDSWNQF
jgi:hypothetical protein